MPKRYSYRIYGLNLASEIELPELPRHSDAASARELAVTVSLTTLDETLAGCTAGDFYLQVSGDQCQFNVDGIARFRIEQGRRILVDPSPGAAPGDVRLFLIGSAFGALLHQRGCLPLHVSSVATPTGVWAFTGESGAGKSTLAAGLHFRFGWPLLSDDVGVIGSGGLDSGTLFHPGPPRLKLWQDAVEHFAIDPNGLTPDLSRINKFHMPLARSFESEPRQLWALVVLERADDKELPCLIELNGIAAFQAVAGTVYRPEMAERLGDRQLFFRKCAALASQITVYRYRRPWSLTTFEGSLEHLFKHLVTQQVRFETASDCPATIEVEGSSGAGGGEKAAPPSHAGAAGA